MTFRTTPTKRIVFNTLIRTHHITNRKKLQRVQNAANQHNLASVLVRFGGSPGIMYAEAVAVDRLPSSSNLQADGENEFLDALDAVESLRKWVAAVHNLRYKDFRCVQRPAPITSMTKEETPSDILEGRREQRVGSTVFREVTSVAEFGEEMERKGLGSWWKQAMGWASS